MVPVLYVSDKSQAVHSFGYKINFPDGLKYCLPTFKIVSEASSRRFSYISGNIIIFVAVAHGFAYLYLWIQDFFDDLPGQCLHALGLE